MRVAISEHMSRKTMIENGTKQANFETIWRIALALDLRPSQLVEQIEQKFPGKKS